MRRPEGCVWKHNWNLLRSSRAYKDGRRSFAKLKNINRCGASQSSSLSLSLATRESSEVERGGGVVVVAGAEGELLELGGELGEVGVVVSVERGVDVVGHVPGAVVKVA